jgi:hypothetical protein
MPVFGQGLYISSLCSASIPFYHPGLVVEQTAHSSGHFERCIGASSFGKSVSHTSNKEKRLIQVHVPRRIRNCGVGVRSKDLI